ncbi:MAG: hypothetical protein ACTSR0_03310 [Candidatus Asgardarchaeia archaeon]
MFEYGIRAQELRKLLGKGCVESFPILITISLKSEFKTDESRNSEYGASMYNARHILRFFDLPSPL